MFLALFSDDEEDILPHTKRKSAIGIKGHSLARGQEDQAGGWCSPTHQLQRIISIEEDHLPQLLQKEYQAELRNWSEEEEDLEHGIDLQMTSIFPSASTPISQCPPPESRHTHTPTSPRGQPVGKETGQSVRSHFTRVSSYTCSVVVISHTDFPKSQKQLACCYRSCITPPHH